eukprot:SAG31_NODE_49244_length_147_cov_19.708333_1_plen_30_part_10
MSGLFKEVLGIDIESQLDRTTSFFDAGGDS